MSEKKDSEDIGFDFSGFKKAFKTFKGAEKIKKHSNVILIIIAVSVAMFLSITLRMQSHYLPLTDEWSHDSVVNSIRQSVRAEVHRVRPNLAPDALETIVNDRTRQILESNKVNMNGQEVDIDQYIKAQSEYFRQQFKADDWNNTYLLAIDPYYYYRHTRNYIEKGYEWDAEDEDGYYESLILAGTPDYMRERTHKKVANVHVLISAWTYKILKVFIPDITIMGALFFVPILISTLVIIPVFFIARKVSGNFGGFFASVLIAIHPAFLNRTAGGFADTDAYVLLFPMLATWFIIEALDSKTKASLFTYSILSGFSIGLLSYAWSGWHFMLLFLIAALVAYMLFIVVVRRDNYDISKAVSSRRFKRSAISLFIMFLTTTFSVSWFMGWAHFRQFIKQIINFTHLKVVGVTKIWPNVYTTVAELNPADLVMTLKQVSLDNNIFLIMGFAGILLPLLFKEKRLKKIDTYIFIISVIFFAFLARSISIWKNDHIAFSVWLALPLVGYLGYIALRKIEVPSFFSILMLIWYAGTIYAASKGIRFIILLVPALSLTVGVTAGLIFIYASDWITRNLDMNRVLINIVVGALVLVLFLTPVNSFERSWYQAVHEIPSMNDRWYDTLIKIRDNSQPDAIINSWWDFGHWFAAISERAVTLDGGRQNNPQAHWLGKLMLTWDEKESVGILRYLDCGANTGFDVLNEYYDQDGLKAITQIYSILGIESRTEALNELMSRGVSSDTAEEVVRYTHCSPPEDFFITSEDMVGKAGVWGHFGAWDFRRASMYNKVNGVDQAEGTKILMDSFGFSSDDAVNMYKDIRNANPDQWIAPWPNYQNTGTCTKDNMTIRCVNRMNSRDSSGRTVVFEYVTVLDMAKKDAVTTNIIKSPSGTVLQQGKPRRPGAVSYIDDATGKFVTLTYEEDVIPSASGRPAGFAIYNEAGRIRSTLMDKDLTASIFTRLFYFENKDGGLEHFDMFHKTTDVTGNKIIVWKVDWDGEALES